MAAKPYDRQRAAHRRLHLGDRGEDVKWLQKGINLRLKRKGLKQRVKVDGVWDKGCRRAYRRVCWLLGLDHRYTTRGNQKLVRIPSRRPERMKRLERKRIAALAAARGPEAAVKWALRQYHDRVRENPAGSNGGPRISDWEREFGFGRVPWCGIFVGKALRTAGVKGITSRVAGVILIHEDGRTARNGFRGLVGRYSGRRGDVVTMFGDGHTELVLRRTPTGYDTVGGNTSYSSGGSQSNGGCVATRHRPFGSITAVVRPRY